MKQTPMRPAAATVGADTQASAPVVVGRVGVFGGAFDPPHNAHVALAEAALAQMNLAQLRIFPTGQAWHKARALSPAADRLAMARLAFEPLPNTVVDPRELHRVGPTYTLDTLRELLAEQPSVQPVLILGADQAATFPSWHHWQEILSIAVVAIAERAGPAGAEERFRSRNWPPWPPASRVEKLDFTPIELSATAIRAMSAAGEDFSLLVPPAVARYIDQHQLYPPPDDH